MAFLAASSDAGLYCDGNGYFIDPPGTGTFYPVCATSTPNTYARISIDGSTGMITLSGTCIASGSTCDGSLTFQQIAQKSDLDSYYVGSEYCKNPGEDVCFKVATQGGGVFTGYLENMANINPVYALIDTTGSGQHHFSCRPQSGYMVVNGDSTADCNGASVGNVDNRGFAYRETLSLPQATCTRWASCPCAAQPVASTMTDVLSELIATRFKASTIANIQRGVGYVGKACSVYKFLGGCTGLDACLNGPPTDSPPADSGGSSNFVNQGATAAPMSISILLWTFFSCTYALDVF